MEKSLDYQSQETEDLKKENHGLLKKMQLYEGMICRNEKDTEYIKEDILQIQAKSMSANLVFHNIPEEDPESSDTTARILKQFFANELKIATPDMKFTELDKVHRFGRKWGKKPRPIVAKFLQFKGKEVVLRHAKNLDKSKKFGINEQLPMQLQNRKQSLMPKFKEARSKSQKSRWLNDKLLVEDRLISAHQDKVRDVNMNVAERAMELKVKSAPPKTQQLSTFQGHAIPISGQDDIIPALRAVQADPRIARAEHNIYAYRFGGKDGVLEHYDDDREWGAGKHILSVLREKNISNTMVVVTRWFGGVHMGAKRFELVKEAASQALELLQ